MCARVSVMMEGILRVSSLYSECVLKIRIFNWRERIKKNNGKSKKEEEMFHNIKNKMRREQVGCAYQHQVTKTCEYFT